MPVRVPEDTVKHFLKQLTRPEGRGGGGGFDKAVLRQGKGALPRSLSNKIPVAELGHPARSFRLTSTSWPTSPMTRTTTR